MLTTAYFQSTVNPIHMFSVQHEIITSTSRKSLSHIVPLHLNMDPSDIWNFIEAILYEFPDLSWLYDSNTNINSWVQRGILPLLVPTASSVKYGNASVPEVLNVDLEMTLRHACSLAEGKARDSFIRLNHNNDTAYKSDLEWTLDSDFLAGSILDALLLGTQPIRVCRFALVKRVLGFFMPKRRASKAKEYLPEYITC